MFFILSTRSEQEARWMGASDDVIYLVPFQGEKRISRECFNPFNPSSS